MSKTKKAAARAKAARRTPFPSTKPGPSSNAIPSPPASSPDASSPSAPTTLLEAGISPSDLETTIETLAALAAHPQLIKTKPCRPLRTAVYEFTAATTTGTLSLASSATAARPTAASLTARVSAALTDQQWVDALVLLAEMRIRREVPKLGALCRWVRDVDAVSGLSIVGVEAEEEPEARREKRMVLRVLDAILRVTEGAGEAGADGDGDAGRIERRAVWDLRPAGEREQVYAAVRDRSLLACNEPVVPFRLLESTPGPERKPPNLHPALLYTSPDSVPILSDAPTNTPSVAHHPHVPGLSLLQDILSPAECRHIIAATENLGFAPDQPTVNTAAGNSVLAHNVYYLIPKEMHDRFWTRIQPLLPAGAKELNRRWRVYRYVPGAEYRCHIDGAWPPSGTVHNGSATSPSSLRSPYPAEMTEAQRAAARQNPAERYVWDASEGKRSSKLTFLIYLNDEFEAGETTFFTPSKTRGEGVLDAWGVKPVRGAAACFPHGETQGSLLHEGTGVRNGAKYVVRTDVEFDVGREALEK